MSVDSKSATKVMIIYLQSHYVACCSSISFTIFFHLCYHIYIEVDAYSYFCQVTRLREYQGVDPHFDTIARQYHDIVKVHV